MAKSQDFGNVILKIGFNDGKYNRELYATEEINSPLIRNVLKYDNVCNAILLEELKPGKTLYSQDDSQKQLQIGCNLLKSISKKYNNKDLKILTYRETLNKTFNYICNRFNEDFLLRKYIHIANRYYEDLNSQYESCYIIHGDFHHDNILLDKNEWKVIDPKGVISFWFTDCARFLLNHFENIPIENRIIEIPKIITKVSELLSLTESVIFKSVFIETILSYSWNFEGYLTEIQFKDMNIEMNDKIDILLKLSDSY